LLSRLWIYVSALAYQPQHYQFFGKKGEFFYLPGNHSGMKSGPIVF